MKKSALSMAVVAAMLGVMVLGGIALAQNHANIVTQSTVDSTFFGFTPTQANIQTFTQNVNALTCDSPTAPTTCSSTSYVKNSQMPGSFTDRPDTGGNSLRPTETIVSSVPDFGCGVWTTNGTAVVPLTSGSQCLETSDGVTTPGINLHDRVNGNVNTAGTNSDGLNSGLGQNTAPSAANTNAGVVGGTDNGTLVGTMTSNVTIAQAADEATEGMPSGFINFTRSETGIVSFSQDILQTISGLYDFRETDGTTASFQAGVPGAPVVNGGFCISNCNTAGFRTSGGGEAVPSYVPALGLPITATLELNQNSMGGEGGGMDVIGPYTIQFKGNSTYPVAGQFFTPGLNVADWANNPATDTDGFPN